MKWVLIGELFQALARATNRPELSESIPRWFGMIGSFIDQREPAVRDLNALKTHIQTMVAEARPPTDEEWDALESRSDDAHDTIQNADLSGDEDGEDDDGGEADGDISGDGSGDDDPPAE